MPDFAVYKTSTGEILRTGGCPLASIPDQAGVGEVSLQTNDRLGDLTDYFDGLDFAPRTSIGATWDKTALVPDGVDEAALSPLPNCTIIVDGVEYSVTDGSFELSVTSEGEYVIEVASVPHLPQEWRITAE